MNQQTALPEQRQGTSNEEIIEKFRRVFKREMTPEERRQFFIDPVPNPAGRDRGAS